MKQELLNDPLLTTQLRVREDLSFVMVSAVSQQETLPVIYMLLQTGQRCDTKALVLCGRLAKQPHKQPKSSLAKAGKLQCLKSCHLFI